MATPRSQQTTNDTELEALRWLQGQLRWEATLADLRDDSREPSTAPAVTATAAPTTDDERPQLAA